jgi:hypothetical protein
MELTRLYKRYKKKPDIKFPGIKTIDRLNSIFIHPPYLRPGIKGFNQP